MWICARCGTEAQRPETCSGCGSAMKPFDQPPKEDRYQFVMLAYTKDKTIDVIGPFPDVMTADQWWEAHQFEARFTGNYRDYEVVLMENPNASKEAP
jgi:hypothetical protein